MDTKGQIVGGGFKDIIIREKNGRHLELGELLIVENELKKKSDKENKRDYTILQVKDIGYGSQAPQGTHELLAGMELEGYNPNLGFMEPELVNYTRGTVKPLLNVQEKEEEEYETKSPKKLPTFLSPIRSIKEEDLKFLKPEKLEDSLYLGILRSGSQKIDVNVYINALKSLTHHILIPATTGRGKSNLVKVMLWGLLESKKAGILVLDPHDEYYGREDLGLKDHPNSKKKLDYYSTEPIIGEGTLIINVKSIKPNHFHGIIDFTDAQKDAMRQLYENFKDEDDGWIIKTMEKRKLQGTQDGTLEVIKRKLRTRLNISDKDGIIKFKSRLFSDTEGTNTIKKIVDSLEEGNTVIIDTSRLSDYEELLIGSIITEKLFYKYKSYKSDALQEKPVISVVIEEAPRVLSNESFGGNSNIYSTIAKEGRKFKIGLIAITQLSSVIPKTILANMNTKIILGNEMALERSAIIDSASQDLSDDNRIIASLDKGEAIVSSVFTKFAVPIYTPEFNKKFIEDYKLKNPVKKTIKGKPNPEG